MPLTSNSSVEEAVEGNIKLVYVHTVWQDQKLKLHR